MLMYYAFTPNSVKSVLRTYLTNQYVILRYCSSNLRKWNYLYGDLPFFKIQVNHFMAQDEQFGAKIIPKCILWVRGLVPFWVLRLSFLSVPGTGEPGGLPSLGSQSRTRLKRLSSSSDYITSNWRLAGGYTFCPLLMPVSEVSLSPLYLNKTLLHKSSERSSLVSGLELNSSPPGAKNPSIFAWFNNNCSEFFMHEYWSGSHSLLIPPQSCFKRSVQCIETIQSDK